MSDDTLAIAAGWQAAGETVAIATVVHTWGSSPRPVGSQLAVTAGGRMAGSVSGGCIEGAAAEAALAMLGQPGVRLIEFGVPDARAWEIGLPCGGRVEIMVQALSPMAGLLGTWLHARQTRTECVLATCITRPASRLVLDTGDTPPTDHPVDRAAHACLAAGQSRLVQIDGESWFLHLHANPPRLIVVGAVHIAQSLVPLALLTGAEVVVCDPRGRYATADRFPDARLRLDWPNEAVTAERPDRATAVVALSHDPKIDDPGLAAALASPCGYIGALGSRRSHQARLVRLADAGVAAGQLARVLGPVGLDLGAISAAEIAVSILAEWIAQRRGAGLRQRTA